MEAATQRDKPMNYLNSCVAKSPIPDIIDCKVRFINSSITTQAPIYIMDNAYVAKYIMLCDNAWTDMLVYNDTNSKPNSLRMNLSTSSEKFLRTKLGNKLFEEYIG